MLAGHATVTLVSKRTGTRFTYEIGSPKNSESNDFQPRFVKVLTGPENTGDYTFVATIFDRFDLRHSKKSSVGPSAPSVVAFRWAWTSLMRGIMPDTLEIWHEGRCGRCGRKLTVPESIASGLGPECAGKALLTFKIGA